MRAILTAALAAATIGLFTASLSAAPASGAVDQNATPLIHLAQYGGGYGGSMSSLPPLLSLGLPLW